MKFIAYTKLSSLSVVLGLILMGCSQQPAPEAVSEAAVEVPPPGTSPESVQPPAEEGYEPAEIMISADYHNVVTYSTTRPCQVKQLGLREAGLTGALEFRDADEIMIFTDKSKMEESPLARIWVNASEGNQYWYRTGGQGSAENHEIKKGNAVVVFTRASTDPIVWKNILY